MSRFGVNLIPNLPQTRISNHSHLLKGMEWPNDREYIAALHGSDWMFYLVALIRNHLIANCEKLFPFTARDQHQALPYIVDLMKLFNPISLLSLYYECLEYYKNCVIAELLEFNEHWYLSIVRSYHTIDDWESDDWFWRFALRQVIFLPRRGLSQVEAKLPSADWVTIPGKAAHSGCPEQHLCDRFPDMVTRIQGIFCVITNDLKGKAPTVSVDGPWGAIAHSDSPFLIAVKNVDHFLLSLYDRLPGQTFAWSMALDILQHNWSLTDWKYNVFATKHYNKLRRAEKEGIVALNRTAQHTGGAHQLLPQQTSTGGSQGPQTTYEPQPFHDLRTKIQMLATDMAFDYCSDHELQLLVSDLDTLVRNPNFPRQGRASYFTVLKHLRSKIQLYNMIQNGSNAQNTNNDTNTNTNNDDNFDDE